jgi:hypothetical protein
MFGLFGEGMMGALQDVKRGIKMGFWKPREIIARGLED